MSHLTPEQSLSTKIQHAGSEFRLGKGLLGALELSVTHQSDPGVPPVYTRLGNSANHYEVEAVINQLAQARSSIVTGSGMSSLALLIFGLAQPGDHVLCLDESYGGTVKFFKNIASRWGVDVDFASFNDWPKKISSKTKFVVVESITNPKCLPQNLREIAVFAKNHGLTSVCDNTFASPIIIQPLALGFDYVYESATKYLNGHSDVIAGVISSNQPEGMRRLRDMHTYFGSFLPPYQCTQLLRGLKTLELRVQAQTKNAKELAIKLQALPFVKRVFYGSSDTAIKNLFNDSYGGMLSIELTDEMPTVKWLDAMKLVKHVPSLGGTETTATIPFYSTNWFMTEQEKKARQITTQLVRFSVGLENTGDLIEDMSCIKEPG
jgi:cystathionine beta-lyase/cystathionine gamma-synthase